MQNLKQELQNLAAFRKKLRDFFDSKNFMEIQTPVLVKTPGVEKHLKYFATQWNHPVRGEHKLYLRSSPEVMHKFLLANGMDAIYEIGPCMRQGEELGPWHSPEFTMLEFYKTGWEYESFMQHCTTLVDTCIDAKKDQPWHRITMAEAFEQFAGVELIDEDTDFAAKSMAAGTVSVKKEDSFEDAFFKTLIEKVEPKIAELGKVVLEKYPRSQSALSKRVGDKKTGYAARFELFLNGIELGNCFLEENEAEQIKSRVHEVFTYRSEVPAKEPIIKHICENGIPPACGAAFGVERLFAAAQEKQNIRSSLDLFLPYAINPNH